MLSQSHDALQTIKSLAIQSIPISVASTYKGIFMEEKVAPLRINPDCVTFKAPKKQICATLRSPVMLHSQVLTESVRAKVQYVNPAAGEICLSNFTFTGYYWRNRQEQRIEPESPIYATLMVQQMRYRANLVNLSQHGAGLMVYLGDSTATDLTLKARVEVSFRLSEQNEFHIPGILASVKFLGYSLAQVGIRLLPTVNQEGWLETYICRRKVDIMNELDHQVVEAYKSSSTEN